MPARRRRRRGGDEIIVGIAPCAVAGIIVNHLGYGEENVRIESEK